MSENQFQYGVGLSSVVNHAPPGGHSSISFGDDSEEPKAPQRNRNQPQEELKAEGAPQEEEKEEEEEDGPKEPAEVAGQRTTDAPTSIKVHAPPGGHSSISFG